MISGFRTIARVVKVPRTSSAMMSTATTLEVSQTPSYPDSINDTHSHFLPCIVGKGIEQAIKRN